MKNKLKNALKNIYLKFNKNYALISIKQAFLVLIPVFIIGAIALMIQSFPITTIRNFIENAFDGNIYSILTIIYKATYGFAAIYLVLSLSYFRSNDVSKYKDIRIFCAISSVICYFASLGPKVLNSDYLMDYTNMTNIFSSLIISFAFTKLFCVFYKKFNKNESDTYMVAFERSMHCVFPTLCCLIISCLFGWLISLIPGISNFNDLIIVAFTNLFEPLKATYIGGFLIMLAESVLWIFGIHGGNVFDTLLNSPTGPFAVNNNQIMSKAFVDTFVLIGGCGTTICLFFAILLFSKERNKKKLCAFASAPIIFNINELLVFGIPIVLNPIYMIPFILTPLVSYSIAYLATYLGLVPQIIDSSVQWTTPIFISGYQATGSIRGSILQLIILIVGILIYMPFVRLEGVIAKENVKIYSKKLTEICRDCESKKEPYHLDGNNIMLRQLEDYIVSKLNNDIKNNKITLNYQPQVKNDKIFAAEALLRFKYDNNDDYLYPPLVVGIALNHNLFKELSKAIVMRVLLDMNDLQKIKPNLKISVNLTLDLLLDDDFRNWLIEKVKGFNITDYSFGVEITEDAIVSDKYDYKKIFSELKNAKIKILMDDFSMGHTSITFLQKNYFDYIKIDGNLIKDIHNERSRNIVLSIISLGKKLNFDIVAEYVECAMQKDTLLEMGCNIFQGYLYYKDMSKNDFLVLLQKDN